MGCIDRMQVPAGWHLKPQCLKKRSRQGLTRTPEGPGSGPQMQKDLTHFPPVEDKIIFVCNLFCWKMWFVKLVCFVLFLPRLDSLCLHVRILEFASVFTVKASDILCYTENLCFTFKPVGSVKEE